MWPFIKEGPRAPILGAECDGREEQAPTSWEVFCLRRSKSYSSPKKYRGSCSSCPKGGTHVTK